MQHMASSIAALYSNLWHYQVLHENLEDDLKETLNSAYLVPSDGCLTLAGSIYTEHLAYYNQVIRCCWVLVVLRHSGAC